MALTKVTDRQVTYKEGGTGSVVRNLGDKLRESVSVEDFGAVGDGVTDDRTAIQNAINAASANGGGMVSFAAGKIYAVGSTTRPYLSLPSNVGLDLNWATLQRIGTNYAHPFIENANGSGTTYNHIIRNGTIKGTGALGQVSDQGSGILMYNASNVLIENIKTENTNGDGLQFRQSFATTIRDCEIGNFGRNGISPTSGEFIYDNLIISGTPISGANPGLDFDAENNSATEIGMHTIQYIKCKNLTFVDFYNTAGNRFGHDIYFIAGDVGPSSTPLRIMSYGGNTTANKVFVGPGVIIKPVNSTSNNAIEIKNTNNVVLAGCTIQRQDTGGSVNGVSIEGTVNQLVMNNVNFLGDFEFSYDITAAIPGALLNNASIVGNLKNVYLKGSNNKFAGGISAVTLSGAGSIGNIFPENTASIIAVDSGTIAEQIFGSARGARSQSFYSSTVDVLDSGSPYVLTIPLPSAALKGRLLFIAAGYSHVGNTGHWAQYLGTVMLGTTASSQANVISSTGAAGKSIAVTGVTTTSITLTLTYVYNGTFSVTVFG